MVKPKHLLRVQPFILPGAWDSDTLIVTSYTGNRVVKLAPDGSIEFLTDSRLNGPVGLCYDDDTTLPYLISTIRIFKVTPEGALLIMRICLHLAGWASLPTGMASIYTPRSPAIRSGDGCRRRF